MSEPRAFISYDFENNQNEKVLFSGQSKLSDTPFAVQDWSSKEDLPQQQWERLINDKISKTNMLIVLVGTATHYASGVIKEIAMAHANNVPVFGVYVGGATAQTPLPTGLQRNRVISWKWDAIASAVVQMMKERKNTQ